MNINTFTRTVEPNVYSKSKKRNLSVVDHFIQICKQGALAMVLDKQDLQLRYVSFRKTKSFAWRNISNVMGMKGYQKGNCFIFSIDRQNSGEDAPIVERLWNEIDLEISCELYTQGIDQIKGLNDIITDIKALVQADQKTWMMRTGNSPVECDTTITTDLQLLSESQTPIEEGSPNNEKYGDNDATHDYYNRVTLPLKDPYVDDQTRHFLLGGYLLNSEYCLPVEQSHSNQAHRSEYIPSNYFHENQVEEIGSVLVSPNTNFVERSYSNQAIDFKFDDLPPELNFGLDNHFSGTLEEDNFYFYLPQ
eukprot:TRINITY_DN524_c0_g1_i1.p1 TRINITY_DN524_c0_g1~~TRINITY_DN524_c0_g1_i1.p1  ORF type:complete len:319 (+),score=65.48 TRINITY_DN524_c0_g1_i1:42-959(+)